MIYLIMGGEYSDQTIDGVYEGPDNLNFLELVTEFYRTHNAIPPDEIGHLVYQDPRRAVYRELASKFEDWLVERAGLKRLKAKELWHGCGDKPPTLAEAKWCSESEI